MKVLSTRLKELRKEKGYSQLDISRILSVSQAAVSNWETGDNEPDSEALKKLAEILEVSVDYLIGHSDVRNPNQGYDIAMAGRFERLSDADKAFIKNLLDRLEADSKK